MSENNIPKKRHWYHNLVDTYRITKRTYSWIAWLLVGSAIFILCLALAIAALTNGNQILWTILGIALSMTIAMTALSLLVRRAICAQIDETVGSVYVVLSQIKSGWITPEEPVNVMCEQDMVWRLTGKPGVVFTSEGPSNCVQPLPSVERKEVSRVIKNVPVHAIQVGRDEGQIELAKLEGRLRKLKKVPTKEEVPAASARLKTLGLRGPLISKGVDPTKARPNRRVVHGR